MSKPNTSAKTDATADCAPVSSPPVTRHTTADITAADGVINPASTRNGVTVVPSTSGSVTPVTVMRLDGVDLVVGKVACQVVAVFDRDAKAASIDAVGHEGLR